jgi:hypothetical protein
MCEHHWSAESASKPDRAGRTLVTFVCDKCDEQLTKLTTRSAREIEAELAAQ